MKRSFKQTYLALCINEILRNPNKYNFYTVETISEEGN